MAVIKEDRDEIQYCKRLQRRERSQILAAVIEMLPSSVISVARSGCCHARGRVPQ
jgi:hypothetical protein